MSEKPSEYLKRTCLICGCHTNQTINIYEPRSGPNIVQLIQAKFKFQPLNEDKYLCFSCNNWLINWHSLQALNSNDAESPAGTFRAQINDGGMLQEQQQQKQQHAAAAEPHNAAVAVKQRPIALVRPMQLIPKSIKPQTSSACKLKRSKHCAQFCQKTAAKCSKCRAENKQNRMSVKQQKHQSSHKRVAISAHIKPLQNLVNSTVQNLQAATVGIVAPNSKQNSIKQYQSSAQQQQQQRAFLPQPRVDGKVIAKLRHLGTSFAIESSSSTDENERINAAEKTRQWSRQLDEDEILLQFKNAIWEVLPTASQTYQTNASTKEQQSKGDTDNSLLSTAFCNGLPSGLSIALI